MRRCECGQWATNQAVMLRPDGTYLFGSPVCDSHRYPVGKLRWALGWEVIEHQALVLQREETASGTER